MKKNNIALKGNNSIEESTTGAVMGKGIVAPDLRKRAGSCYGMITIEECSSVV